jgi:LEA14-like dessication related protein
MIQRRLALHSLAALALATGCATVGADPVQVQLVGIQPVEGEGMEIRLLCELRVQNPNEAPLQFTGVFVELQVQGSTVATGVADLSGTIPRYGEALLVVPVSTSFLRLAGQAIGIFTRQEIGPIAYALKGKIAGPAFAPVRFESRGELDLARFAPRSGRQ